MTHEPTDAPASVSLVTLVAHACEVLRSNPAHYPVLDQFPTLTVSAKALVDAATAGEEAHVILAAAVDFQTRLASVKRTVAVKARDPGVKDHARDRLAKAKQDRQARANAAQTARRLAEQQPRLF